MKAFEKVCSLGVFICLASGLLFAAGNGPGAGQGPGGDPPMGMGPGKEFADQMKALRAELDEVLVAASEEYAELSAKEDKTFEDLRRLAELRRELIAESEEAQGVLAEMNDVKDAFKADKPHGPNGPPDDRPVLTEEQQAAVAAHKETMEELGAELEEILKAANEEYAALAAKEDKTMEDLRRMHQLRQQILGESEEAQAKLDEIKDAIAVFRDENPGLPARGRVMQGIRRRAEAVKTLKDTVDEMLAGDSPRYAELLGDGDKTPEQVREMVQLRRQLLQENEDARQLQNAAMVMNGRLQGTLRRIRKKASQVDEDAAGE